MLLAYNLREGKNSKKRRSILPIKSCIGAMKYEQKKFVSSLKVSFNTFILARSRSLEIKGQIVKANMSGYSAE